MSSQNPKASSQSTQDSTFNSQSTQNDKPSYQRVDNFGQPYTITSTGTNNDGNHYCHRDYGDNVRNTNSYHYSNTDGSYYYSNPDGSKYYNSGDGYTQYTRPSDK
ncbi:hypothetical protein MBLNU459_g6299t1 [Dothideomycetes sp. NU459]